MSAPQIRLLEPGDEALLEAFLLPRIESSMFLLGNMQTAGLVDKGIGQQGTYVAAIETNEQGDAQITAVVSHYANGNLIPQAPVHLDELWRAAVRISGREVRGAVGPADQVQAIIASLSADVGGIHPNNVQMDYTEYLYRLDLNDLIVPDLLTSGQVQGRRGNMGDIDVLVPWRVAYNMEALGVEDTPDVWEHCQQSVERYLQIQRSWVLERKGDGVTELVATTNFNTAIPQAVQVGGVWTPPELRSRGYARAVVAASLLDARDEGASLGVLFTDRENVAAQKSYESLGFARVGDYCLFGLKKGYAL
ncbi:MAG: GNAT family N-acetyltransferase [Chloroflexota bacterium]